MASPNVAGSLGLVQQHAKNVRGSMLLGATLKGLAIHTANEAGPANGPDYMYGWGILNVAGCIKTLNSAQTTSGILENTLAQGASFEINVYNDGLTPLQATISWYDPAGPVNAVDSLNVRTARLVNDLDLRITRMSDGNTEFPWTLNPNSPSAAATKADNIKDNVEKVAILSPVAGWYTIRVTHKGTLNGNQQNYSLIYTGRQICANLNQFPTASISAPLKGAGPYTISALQTQAQHNRMTGALAGRYTMAILKATLMLSVFVLCTSKASKLACGQVHDGDPEGDADAADASRGPLPRHHAGTHLTCFTGTNVLALLVQNSVFYWHPRPCTAISCGCSVYWLYLHKSASILTLRAGGSQRMSESSCAAYRRMVYETPNFVEYFRSITPEQVCWRMLTYADVRVTYADVC
jgi:hypothetical protein